MNNEKTIPAPGTIWEHYNGTPYTVLHIANEPNDERYPLTVVYQGPNGKIWTRRADDWHRSMKAGWIDRGETSLYDYEEW